MTSAVLWLVVVTCLDEVDTVNDAVLRDQIASAGGVVLETDGSVAMTVAAATPDAARRKALRELPELGPTSVRVTRPGAKGGSAIVGSHR